MTRPEIGGVSRVFIVRDATAALSFYRDKMHFEVVATPAELLRGFEHAIVITSSPLAFPVIRRGAKGPLVVQLQDLLQLQRTTGTGTFGPRTEAAVRLYQQRHGLEIDGIVGHATWTALLTDQPPLSVSGIPLKRWQHEKASYDCAFPRPRIFSERAANSC